MRMREETIMGRLGREKKEQRWAVVMTVVLLLIQGLIPFLPAGEAESNVYAATPETASFELDVSEDMIYYGDWFTRLMQFRFKDTGETERAYCMNPELFPPGEGTHTATIYNYKNVPDDYRALWKALYYLEGGPGYPEVASVWNSVYQYDPAHPNEWTADRKQAYALSHMVVSELSPVGSTGTVGAGSEYIQLMNNMISKIRTMPDPPKTFQIAVYVSGSGLQNVSGYCAPLSVTGTLRLSKHSADTRVSAGNALYSLAGAEYGVYTDADCKTKVASFVTDKDGKSSDVTLEEGTYYVCETKASPGYALDPTVYTVDVTADETTEVSSEETPQRAVPEWFITKTDRESSASIPKGAASLKGALFEVSWYAGRFNSEEEAQKAAVSKRTWQFKTDENGRVLYDTAALADGDDLFLDKDGRIMVPCGTLFIRELTPPEGYLLNEETFQIHIDPAENTTDAVIRLDAKEQLPLVPEQVMRGGFRFNKLKEGSAEAVAMVPFRITSETTGESHILVTDANGIADTESYAHETNCNANDNAFTESGEIDESLLDPSAGIWFNGTAPQDGSDSVTPDNRKRALPYDTYRVEELRCSANTGYRLVAFTVRIDRDQVMIDRGTVTDYKDVSIHTLAICEQTKSHYAPQIGRVTITDTVSYEDAKPGEMYRLVGVLMDRDTGAPIEIDGKVISSSKTFTADQRSGKTDLSFEIEASELAGKTTVVYEELYRDDVCVASHKNINDEGQTVRFPVIATQAARQKDGSVIDKVMYSGLKEGETYTMHARMIDLDTKEILEDVEGSTTFTAASSKGEIEVKVDTSSAGHGYRVVYERCMKDGRLVALHEDASCKEQTVLLPEQPSAGKAHNTPDRSPRTGDPFDMRAFVWIMAGAAAALVSAAFAWKRES